MKTAPFSVGAPRAFSARQVMTVRNGKTVAETDRCREGARSRICTISQTVC